MDENNRTCVSSAKVVLTDDQKSEIFNLFDKLNGNILYSNRFKILEPSNGCIGRILNIRILLL